MFKGIGYCGNHYEYYFFTEYGGCKSNNLNHIYNTMSFVKCFC